MIIRLLFILLFILTSLASTAREIFDFNKGWSFTRTLSTDAETLEVDLPHIWGATGGNERISPLYKGCCYYLKEVKIPSSLENKDLYLRFNGVSTVATIYVNGKYVTEHRGGFTAFNVNITPYIKLNAYNSITVAVSNAYRSDMLPLGALDRNIPGGIYAGVELIALDKTHISLSHYGSKGVYISTKEINTSSAEIQTVVMVDGAAGDVVELDIEIINRENVTVGKGNTSVRLGSSGSVRAVTPITVEFPKLWDGVENPYLYSARVKTLKKGSVTDELTTTFGIREFKIDDNQFILNGNPYPIRGVIATQDKMVVGSAYNSQDFKNDAELILEMGATAVRNIDAPITSAGYEQYDASGLIAWADFPLSSDGLYSGKGYIEHFGFKENGKEQLYEMLYQLFNHPSICFWGIFNEISTRGDDPTEYIRELNNIARNVTPERITVSSSIEDGIINQITEAISWPIYFGWNRGNLTDFEIWIKQIESGHSSLKSCISEYGSKGGLRSTSTKDGEPKITPKQSQGGEYTQSSQAAFHEYYHGTLLKSNCFWGAFINSMFDYSNGDLEEGQWAKYNTMGLVSYDRSVKKDAFYYYKANWNDKEQFIHITNRDDIHSTASKQNIKAYTNLSEASLIVNGENIGTKSSHNGIVEWDNISLEQGDNSVVVISGEYVDRLNINLYKSIE